MLPNYPQINERIIVPVDPRLKEVEIINEFTSRRNSRASIQTTPCPILTKQHVINPFVIVARSSQLKTATPLTALATEAPRAGPSSRGPSEARKLISKKFNPTQSPKENKQEKNRLAAIEAKHEPARKTTRIFHSTTEIPSRSKQTKRNPKNFEVAVGDNPSSYNIFTNYEPQKSRKAGPHKIQPLHISTKGFNGGNPQKNGKPIKVQKEKIKLDKLPPNPTEIPTTTFFDNLGKYHYGILHGEMYTEPPEYAQKQQRRAAIEPIGENVVQAPPPLQPKVFKSSFRDPKIVQPVIVNDHLGNFLYKSEVHYPTYRNNLYPPVITYGGPDVIAPTDGQPSSKELPPPIVYKQPPPQYSKPVALSPPASPAPPAPPRTKDESADVKKPDDEEEDEDYEEEGDEEDYDEGEADDRSDGNANAQSEDDEEESGELEETPTYRYAYGDHSPTKSGESDEFDRAWRKYGYGPNTDDDENGSYESSETIARPQRIKFYHEIKEEVTTPLRSSTMDPLLEERFEELVERPPWKSITKSVSGKLNHTQFHPRTTQKPPQKPEVKRQEKQKPQRSDAAAKFFQ